MRPGTYELTDKTYAQLVRGLRDQYFADTTPELRQSILAFCGDLSAPIATKRHDREGRDLVSALAELRDVRTEQSLMATSPGPRRRRPASSLVREAAVTE